MLLVLGTDRGALLAHVAKPSIRSTSPSPFSSFLARSLRPQCQRALTASGAATPSALEAEGARR